MFDIGLNLYTQISDLAGIFLPFRSRDQGPIEFGKIAILNHLNWENLMHLKEPF